MGKEDCMNNKKIYYLETNVLYSLVNSLNIIAENVEAHTSLFALEEIVSGICEDNFTKRKKVLTKIINSKLKIMPYMPQEMLLAAFGKDISELNKIILEKKYLWVRTKAIISSDSYEQYYKKIIDLYKISVREEEKENTECDFKIIEKMIEIIRKCTKELNVKKKEDKKICKEYEVERLIELPQDRKIEGVNYFEIDTIRAFGLDEENPDSKEDSQMERRMLVDILNSMNLIYEEKDIEELVRNRKKEKLYAFLLGSLLYSFYWSNEGRVPKRNDTMDICHLVYLENKNYIIVSNDKIYEKILLPNMTIKPVKLINLLNR